MTKDGRSHQASKSTRTRNAILDATLECLAELSYPEVTISAVSCRSGVSKGGIQYHYPSRQELLSEAVGHLFERRLAAFQNDLSELPSDNAIADHIIDSHWKHLKEPEFQIYQQLIVASRSNPSFRELLVRKYRAFMSEWRELSLQSFGWDTADVEVARLGNIAQFLMDGMAYGRFADQLSDKEVVPMLNYAKDLIREGLRRSLSAE
jgi:AcrR family transcriptional regulator